MGDRGEKRNLGGGVGWALPWGRNVRGGRTVTFDFLTATVKGFWNSLSQITGGTSRWGSKVEDNSRKETAIVIKLSI